MIESGTTTLEAADAKALETLEGAGYPEAPSKADVPPEVQGAEPTAPKVPVASAPAPDAAKVEDDDDSAVPADLVTAAEAIGIDTATIKRKVVIYGAKAVRQSVMAEIDALTTSIEREAPKVEETASQPETAPKPKPEDGQDRFRAVKDWFKDQFDDTAVAAIQPLLDELASLREEVGNGSKAIKGVEAAAGAALNETQKARFNVLYRLYEKANADGDSPFGDPANPNPSEDEKRYRSRLNGLAQAIEARSYSAKNAKPKTLEEAATEAKALILAADGKAIKTAKTPAAPAVKPRGDILPRSSGGGGASTITNARTAIEEADRKAKAILEAKGYRP